MSSRGCGAGSSARGAAHTQVHSNGESMGWGGRHCQGESAQPNPSSPADQTCPRDGVNHPRGFSPGWRRTGPGPAREEGPGPPGPPRPPTGPGPPARHVGRRGVEIGWQTGKKPGRGTYAPLFPWRYQATSLQCPPAEQPASLGSNCHVGQSRASEVDVTLRCARTNDRH